MNMLIRKSKYRSYKYEYDFAGRLISEKGAYTVNGIAGGAYRKSYFRSLNMIMKATC